jgi:hypothetical protein
VAVTVTIPPGRLGAFIKGSVNKNADAVRRGIRNGMLRGISVLKKNTPVDQGIMKNAWKLVGVVGTKGLMAILNDAPHAGIVERGARPHMPPLEPILEWVKRHLRNFGLRAPRFKAPRQGPLRTERAYAARAMRVQRHVESVADFEDEVLAIAEAIRWKIYKKGQEGTYFVRNSLPELRAAVEEEINRALAKALAAQGD